MAETDLYPPIKTFLESQGYVVKAEIKSCDVVGVRGDELPVIIELKAAFTLQLIFQAIDRLAMTETVYIAIARPKRGIAEQVTKLCRRIGIGFIVVSESGSLEVVADPLPYAPRQNVKRRGLLLREFAKREGDPNLGGSNGKLVTAYRQDAIKCLAHLKQHGPTRVKDIRLHTGVDRAAAILRDNHYGWFRKESRGVYGVAS
jgi:hypothetical protein